MRPLACLFCATVLLFGCAAKTTVTNPPTGVSASVVSSWYAAAGALDQITKAADAGLQITEQLHSAGILPDGPQYTGAMQAFGKIFQTSQIARNALAAVPAQQFTTAAPAGFAGYVNDMSTAVTQLNQTGVTSLKNSNSQATAAHVVSNITTAVVLLQSIVKGG